MRTSLLLTGSLILSVLSMGACSRMHLYKKSGQATVAAFATQSAGTDAPRPRGIDGDEASSIIDTEAATFAPGNDAPASNAGGGGGGGKPAGIPLQAR